ncbi:hypothetical protein Mapa_009414 [Marchantia paleacea]|nr:hypothetical protein Mapa_009414 [Marchantia paleacea]
MYVPLLRPFFFMCCSFRYAQILIGFCWFLTAMAIYLSIWVAPSDFQQGENYRIIYVHVPAAWMSLLIYIAMAISVVFWSCQCPALRASLIGQQIHEKQL